MKNFLFAALAVVALLMAPKAEAQSNGSPWTGAVLPPNSGDLIYCADDVSPPLVGPCLPASGIDASYVLSNIIDVMRDNVYCPDWDCDGESGYFTVYDQAGGFGVFHWSGVNGQFKVIQTWHGYQCYSIFSNACDGHGPPPDTGSLGG